MNNGNIILILIITVVLLFLVRWLRSKFKSPAVGSIALVNGGVKTGKTTYSVNLCRREIKARLRAHKLRLFLRKVFFMKTSDVEEPLLYSNIPLNIKGVKCHELTREHLLREKRFNYGSVVYLSEFSLIADSRLVHDEYINDKLLEFFKLFGHETKGGLCVVDTQSILDAHFSLKRCLDRHLYIYETIKWLPFFLLMRVREERYAEDGTVVNSYTEDLEESLKRVLVPKSTWKCFDCYCYSALTDDNGTTNKKWSSATLKCKDYISLKRSKNKPLTFEELKSKYHGVQKCVKK